MTVNTTWFLGCVITLVCCIVIFNLVRTYSSPILGAGTAAPGDLVVVRFDSYVGTGRVVEVTEKFDEKHGSYACYRICFGRLENGKPDIWMFPFRFVEKIAGKENSDVNTESLQEK